MNLSLTPKNSLPPSCLAVSFLVHRMELKETFLEGRRRSLHGMLSLTSTMLPMLFFKTARTFLLFSAWGNPIHSLKSYLTLGRTFPWCSRLRGSVFPQAFHSAMYKLSSPMYPMILVTLHYCIFLASRSYISLRQGQYFIHLCDLFLSGPGMWQALMNVCLVNEYIDDSVEELSL